MAGIVGTTLLTLNTSFLNDTSSVTDDDDDDDQTNFASAYLDHDVTHVLWLVVPPTLLVLGCYGNVMTVVVMRGMRASASTACLSVYFTALAVSDLFGICGSVLFYWPAFAFRVHFIYFHDLACTIPLFVLFVTSLTSAWFLVAMTCQRLTSVVLPHRVGVLCTARTGKIVTAVIVSVAVVLNVHFFFHYRVEYYAEEGYGLFLSDNKTAAKVFALLELCLASFVPFVLLIVANAVLIYRALRSLRMAGKMTAGDTRQTTSRSARVSSMTTTLVLTSAAFLVLTLPTYLLNIYLETIGYYDGGIDDERLSRTLALVDTVAILLWMSNSAINLYLYILSGRKFRQEPDAMCAFALNSIKIAFQSQSETRRYVCLCFEQRQNSLSRSK